MSRRPDRTTTGGYDTAFHTTHWTEIFDAGSEEQPCQQAALAELLKQYWKPVYSYLRCKGYERETAKDLTQGFFHEIVLGRSLIQQADRSKGRFRTFLLTALDRYVTDIHRTEKRKKRMPEAGIISLDDVDWLAIPDRDGTPTQVFDHAWASAVLDQALAAVEANYRSKNKAAHWDVFRARIVDPIMENAECPALPDLCEKYGISDTAKASKMIIRVKRRFRTLLRRHVRQLVNSDAEVDDEIRYLMQVFSKGPGATELAHLFSPSARRPSSSQ
jgi:DNA-directed RNA polymerase specialized sigma24 family protein